MLGNQTYNNERALALNLSVLINSVHKFLEERYIIPMNTALWNLFKQQN